MLHITSACNSFSSFLSFPITKHDFPNDCDLSVFCALVNLRRHVEFYVNIQYNRNLITCWASGRMSYCRGGILGLLSMQCNI